MVEGTLFDQVFATFIKYAGEFKMENNQLPVLVLLYYCCESDHERIHMLQQIAKNGIVRRRFKTILVGEEAIQM